MADIQLRFNADMLVLSTPIQPQLERIGIDSLRDNELTLLLEPEILDEIYTLEAVAGAQCIVTDTSFMTPARLARVRMDDRAYDLARSAMETACKPKPQHVLVEIGSCDLPLDASSKTSLMENRDQYTRAAETFGEFEPLIDAYFLNGFTRCTDLKCALMGLRKTTDKPIFASVTLGDDDTLGGLGRERLDEAASIMAEYGAQVLGFETCASPEKAAQLAQTLDSTNPMLPRMVQLCVKNIDPEQKAPTKDNPYYEPDTMVDAADILKAAGVQFLRATGHATPSYTGALVASTLGDMVQVPATQVDASSHPSNDEDLSELAAKLRVRINDALNGN